MEIFSLDLETRAVNPRFKDHAGLEPWRRRHGTAEIMSCDVYKPDGTSIQIVNDSQETFTWRLRELLKELKGKTVYAHNATFDIAWLIADLQPHRCGTIPSEVNDVNWRDTGLLVKWLINGQKAETSHFSLALANLVKTFLPEHPDTADFVAMKSEGFSAGENPEYWLQRGSLDVKMTHALAMKYQLKVPVSMRQGLKTEFGCLVPIANSWITGFKVNQNKLDENEHYYREMKSEIAKTLGVSEGVFSSPKQMAALLFGTLGLIPNSRTPTGAPGTSKGDIMWLEYKLKMAGEVQKAGILRKILEAKESATIYSKYVKTMIEALEHTGDGHIYGAPRIFGTYTGRMTYSNSTLKKYKTGIALHQIPRKAKRVRESLEPPEGYKVSEFDAAAQESRLMAIRAQEQTMIEIFNNNLNFHSMTGSSIIGMDYEDFEESRQKENDDGPMTEARQRGKLTNLACNFRIGGAALSKQAFEKYEMMIDVPTGNHLVKTFVTKYRGVPRYWDDVVWNSRESGYTEAFGGRRFKLSDWSQYRWATESSAISFPIQGGGASMKEIAISELHKNVPEYVFALDLHDASFGYLKQEHAVEIHKAAEHCLNNIDYSKYWGFTPQVALPYDGKLGSNFAEVK